jgi:hypothetical protein
LQLTQGAPRVSILTCTEPRHLTLGARNKSLCFRDKQFRGQ